MSSGSPYENSSEITDLRVFGQPRERTGCDRYARPPKGAGTLVHAEVVNGDRPTRAGVVCQSKNDDDRCFLSNQCCDTSHRKDPDPGGTPNGKCNVGVQPITRLVNGTNSDKVNATDTQRRPDGQHEFVGAAHAGQDVRVSAEDRGEHEDTW